MTRDPKTRTVRIHLTPQQREQIARATGHDLCALDLRPGEYREQSPVSREPVRVGRSLFIQPSEMPLVPVEGEHHIALDLGQPGAATVFGTGLHATTQLSLTMLEEWIAPGDRVLDLGTGSGILALAAARLGAQAVLALDTDPLAVAAARKNVATNGLAAVVEVRAGSLEAAGDPPYDLVVANLPTYAVLSVVDHLAHLVGRSGRILLGGLRAANAPGLVAAFRAAGFHVEAEQQQGELQGLVLKGGMGDRGIEAHHAESSE